jgi:TldD protein
MSDALKTFETGLGLDDALYRRVMATALGRGGDLCDLFFQQRAATTIGLEDGEVNRAYRVVDLGVGIRVVQGDSTGYAFSEELDEASLQEAAGVAAAIAGAGAVAPPQEIRASALPQRYPVQTAWSQVTTGERLPLLQRVNERAMSADPRLRKVRLRFADSETQVLVVDSSGRKSYDLQPMTIMSVSCVAEENGRREENYHSMGGRHGLELYTPEFLDQLADEAVAKTLLLFQASRPPAGEMPVVLAAGSSGILLHEAIGHGMEADFNRKGISIFADRVGTPVARDFVSIVDDGTLPSARGSINVDDEGNAVGCTTLVEKGVLRSYLHDRISARHYKVEPTGNGRRESFRHAPLPRMRSTYMLPGPHAREEIIASVKRGLYAMTFSNGQVQIGAGDFTFYIKTGYLIEDGKLTTPIKDVNIIGNGPRVLQDIEMVADDLVVDRGGWTCGKDGQSVPVSQGLPTVKVSSITVGGMS